MTTSQDGRPAGEVVPRAAPAGGRVVAGLQPGDVEDLYAAVHRLAGKQLAALRRLQEDAAGRLRLANVEQEQLARFRDEIDYRLRSPGAPPDLLSTGGARLRAQQTVLAARQAELATAHARLSRLDARLARLVQQIEAGARYIDEPETSAASGDPWAPQMRAGLIRGQEAERSRLAREIHDGPAQALTNTLLRLQFLEMMLTTRPAEAAAEVAGARDAVRASLQDMRRFIFNLRPASLQDAGLTGTLGRLVTEYRDQTGTAVEATWPAEIALAADQELVVFRIVQEALQNVRKHAGATQVQVALHEMAAGWVVTIVDNGRGFPGTTPEERPEVSSGLVGIRERAAAAAGTLDIRSTPGAGTVVTLTLPRGLGPGQPAAAPLDAGGF